MRTIETQVFIFNELSDEAKEKARNDYRQTTADFFDFYAEQLINNVADTAELFGLDIRQNLHNCKHVPSVYYSGFYHQGSGCAFKGKYSYKKGALFAIKKEYPSDTKLHNIVEQLQKAQSEVFYRATADCSTKGYNDYYQRVCVDIENWPSNGLGVESEITEALENFAHWIYKRLEAEYEYTQSAEFIDDMMMNNDYEFTANGKLI